MPIVRVIDSNGTTSIAATTASNGTASNAAPHRKNAAQRTRSDSPYQQRTSQKDNPTQVIIKQAVDYLIQQLEEGLSDAAALQENLPEIKVRAVYCGSLERFSPPGEDILLRSLKWGARQYRKWRSTAPPGTAAQKERPVPAYPFSPLPEAYVAALANELKLGIDLVQVEFAEK